MKKLNHDPSLSKVSPFLWKGFRIGEIWKGLG